MWDNVFLKVSSWKKILRFDRKGKLSIRFIGLYEIIEMIGSMAYHLALPPKLDKIHNNFHMSILRRYSFDPYHILAPDEIELQPNLTYDEKPVKILT